MKRITVSMALIALLVLALVNNVALGQGPPAPVVRYQFRAEGLPLPGPFDVVHQILNFPPGATTPWHTHPGLVLVTVLEGENTFRMDGTEKVYKVGESFVEHPGHVAQAHNATTANMTVFASYVLPDEAALSVPLPDDTTPLPRPSAGYQIRTDGLAVPGDYEVAQVILDFAPGAATPWHTHPGQVVVTVLEGTLTFNVNGTDQVYQAGQGFVELPNEVARASNATGARTSVMATYLLPKGAPLSHPAEPPASGPVSAAPQLPAPAPGGGHMQHPVALPDTGMERRWMHHLIVATVLLASGIVVRRRMHARR